VAYVMLYWSSRDEPSTCRLSRLTHIRTRMGTILVWSSGTWSYALQGPKPMLLKV